MHCVFRYSPRFFISMFLSRNDDWIGTFNTHPHPHLFVVGEG